MVNMSESTLRTDSRLEKLSSFAEYVLLNDIKQLSTTKKSLWSLENKKYTFLVSPWLTKPFIKLAIEKYFDVQVKKINTLNLPLRKKYVGRYIGYKTRLKKAIVTLESNSEISLFSDI